jgi:hypothetical protein
MILLNFSIFFWDFFAGQFTQPFFVLEPYYGVAMFYVYMISFFTSFLVLWGILRSDKFGMGFMIWLPYAIIGLVVEAYFELILNPVLKGYWGVIGYCVFGLLTGLSADITFKICQDRLKMRGEIAAGIAGVIMSMVYFLTILIAISFFYLESTPLSWQDPSTFTGLAYFGLPWMIFNAFFGGIAAYAIHMLYPIKNS